MSRHEMPDLNGLVTETSTHGLVSEDVWREMVEALQDAASLDRVHLTGVPAIPLSRGRHHFPGYYEHSAPDRDFDRGDWQSLPDGGVFIYANQFTPTVFRRLVTDTDEGYETISSCGITPDRPFRYPVPRHGR